MRAKPHPLIEPAVRATTQRRQHGEIHEPAARDAPATATTRAEALHLAGRIDDAELEACRRLYTN